MPAAGPVRPGPMHLTAIWILAAVWMLVPRSAASQPAIQITSLPPYGSSGFMQGVVRGVDFGTHRVAAYIQVEGLGWWTKPTRVAPTVPIDASGGFTVNVTTGGLDHLATIFCAAIVPAGDTPPLAGGDRRVPPSLNALAITCRERFGRTLTFAGRTWAVKDASAPVGPGSNVFSSEPSDVWVDAAGLHLTIHFRNGRWWSSEVILLDDLGYGTYVFKTQSPVAALDVNATLGLFTWDSYGDGESSGDSHNRELDIEDSRWGDPAGPNTQAVVQPWDVVGNRHRFNLPANSPGGLTRAFTWRPESVRFLTLSGDRSADEFPAESLIDEWNYGHDPAMRHYVPTHGRERVRLNLWLNRLPAPSNGQPIEVVISSFSFVRCSYAVSFPFVTASAPARGASATASVSTTADCGWGATSDAPWFAITSGEAGAGSGTVRFTVTPNPTRFARTATVTIANRSFKVRQNGRTATAGDFDGDGREEVTVFRPSNGIWYLRSLANGQVAGYQWGSSDDIPTPGDFDGDGVSDLAVFRPSNGTWYVRYLGTGATAGFQWGNSSDRPVPGDYNGDGRTDLAVFRPSDGVWYIWYSGLSTATGFQWGSGSDVPVPGDYNGDGKTDVAVFRPLNGVWYVLFTDGGMAGIQMQWGNANDITVPGDYDGDGISDLAVFRPSNGTWYVRYTGTGGAAGFQWGNVLDVPVPADYNADALTDLAVFRPSNGTWYIWYSGGGQTAGVQWGNGNDIPILKRP